jgi:hypothetical protein
MKQSSTERSSKKIKSSKITYVGTWHMVKQVVGKVGMRWARNVVVCLLVRESHDGIEELQTGRDRGDVGGVTAVSQRQQWHMARLEKR